MSNNAAYASTPRTAQAQVSTANTARDGSGTLGTVLQSGANGSRIDDIAIAAAGTCTAGMIRLFLSDGTYTRLWKEVPVAAVTPSGTIAVWSATLTNLGLVLKTGWSLLAATNNAEAFNVIVTRGGDF